MKSNVDDVMYISRIMKNVCSTILIIIPVGLILIWMNFEAAREIGFFHRLPSQMDNLTTMSYFGGFVVSGSLTFIVLMAVKHLRDFFILNSDGRMFSADSASSLYRFSKYFILYALLSIPIESILGVLLTMGNPVGERVMMISLQTYDLTQIFLGFVLFAISWVINESVKIAEENAQII